MKKVVQINTNTINGFRLCYYRDSHSFFLYFLRPERWTPCKIPRNSESACSSQKYHFQANTSLPWLIMLNCCFCCWKIHSNIKGVLIPDSIFSLKKISKNFLDKTLDSDRWKPFQLIPSETKPQLEFPVDRTVLFRLFYKNQQFIFHGILSSKFILSENNSSPLDFNFFLSCQKARKINLKPQ